jgi:hypothetical protein
LFPHHVCTWLLLCRMHTDLIAEGELDADVSFEEYWWVVCCRKRGRHNSGPSVLCVSQAEGGVVGSAVLSRMI